MVLDSRRGQQENSGEKRATSNARAHRRRAYRPHAAVWRRRRAARRRRWSFLPRAAGQRPRGALPGTHGTVGCPVRFVEKRARRPRSQGATAALPWAASRRTRVAAAPAVRCKAGETPALRRPGGDRAPSVSRFGWGRCNREAGVSVSWTRRARERARRPRSQGAASPPRCSVLGARSARAVRHPVRNCVQDILAQYTPCRRRSLPVGDNGRQ
jgi:hypothetical protein